MIKFQKLFRSKAYQKIYMSYIALILITIITLSVVLFYIFSMTTIKEIVNYSTYDLKQKSYAAQTIEEQVVNLSVQLINNPKIVSYFGSSDNSKINEYYISMLLKDIYAMYPFIESVELMNTETGVYYHAINFTDKAKKDIQSDTEQRAAQNTDKYLFCISRSLADPYNTPSIPSKQVISFFVFGNYYTSHGSMMVLNVDHKYLQSIINSIGSDKGEYIIDAEGYILSHDQSDMIGTQISSDYISKIIESPLDKGYFYDDDEGEKIIVQFAKASNLEWYLVANQSYRGLVANILNVRMMTIIIAIIIFLVGAITAFWMSGGIYNPLKLLVEGLSQGKKADAVEKSVDEYALIKEIVTQYKSDTLFAQNNMDKAFGLVKSYAVSTLLKGSDMTVLKQLMEFNYINDLKFLSETENNFCVFVCRIDDIEMLKKQYTDENEVLVYYGIINIMKDVLDGLFDNEIVTSDNNEIAVLAYGENVSVESYIMLAFHDIQDIIKAHFDLTLSVGVGQMCYSLDKISDSYRRAVDYQKLCFFYGNNVIIDNEVAFSHAKSKKPPQYDIDKNIINNLFVRNSDKDRTIDYYLSLFIDDISLSGYEDAKKRIVKLTDSIKSKVYTNLDIDHYDPEIIDLRCRDVVLANNLGKTQQCIKRLVQDIRDIVIKLGRDDMIAKHKKLIKEVKQYLIEHYKDPTLSATVVAEHVGVSPGYLGKLFKQIENTSFVQSLATIRLERSKKLLEEDNRPVFMIAEEVGIVSAAYFTTLFKKYYGCTPSQYREMMQEKKKRI